MVSYHREEVSVPVLVRQENESPEEVTVPVLVMKED